MADDAPAAEVTAPPPAPQSEPRKKSAGIHWVRPKSHVYEYNFGYGSQYYRPMLDYLDMRNCGYRPETPRPQSFAERSFGFYHDLREERKKGRGANDVELLHRIHRSSNEYFYHNKRYAKKLSNQLF